MRTTKKYYIRGMKIHLCISMPIFYVLFGEVVSMLSYEFMGLDLNFMKAWPCSHWLPLTQEFSLQCVLLYRGSGVCWSLASLRWWHSPFLRGSAWPSYGLELVCVYAVFIILTYANTNTSFSTSKLLAQLPLRVTAIKTTTKMLVVRGWKRETVNLCYHQLWYMTLVILR